jgi:hypothetical protein
LCLGGPADVPGFEPKRLKGFEPSTFCMAIGLPPTLTGNEYAQLQGFVAVPQTAAIGYACGYAPRCSHSGTRAHECPKFEVAVSFPGPTTTIGRAGRVS